VDVQTNAPTLDAHIVAEWKQGGDKNENWQGNISGVMRNWR